ncbi:MAG: hypothetical protein I8H71_02570 [Xanthomonadaceae bacterium]|nr:hypothetical protein [Xanthomonadaceae bacterium]
MSSRRFFLVVAPVIFFTRGANANEPARFALRIAGGKLVEGPQVIKLTRNAAVVLTVVSDTADELHVHGYNLTLKLVPNQAATLRFTGKHTGRFSFELHKTHREIGAFEIYPD